MKVATVIIPLITFQVLFKVQRRGAGRCGGGDGGGGACLQNMSIVRMYIKKDASPYVDSESDNECRRPKPNGRKYWFPDIPVEEKPTEGDVFDNFDEAYNMYLEYSQKARFSIRKSTTKRKNGNITHKYILCSKAGKPRKTIVKDTLVQDNQKEVDQNEGAKTNRKNRYSSFTVTDCKAAVRFKAIHGTKCYKLYDFVENHNHPLVDENNLDNLKARRKLDFSDKVFIHRASLSNIGPTKAHRLRVAFMGGYHKVRGKAIDWKNFRRSLNKYIGPRDAQMLVDKMNDRKKHVPNFSFEYKTVNDELSRMFWADETMKCNYIAFGDVVSFDATYRTNRYQMIFVPFTSINHHQKCVTFGAGLLSDETFESYTWILTAFKRAHGKEPLLAVTDQDAALRKAIEYVFPQSHHRLCMWHITQKLPGKRVRKRPTTSAWSAGSLNGKGQEELTEEIASGGLGLGEKESPFMEEDENGFLEDLEGFASKLGKYIETIAKSKTCFDKTLAIGMEVFPDSGLLKDLEAKYAEGPMQVMTDGLQATTHVDLECGSLKEREEEEITSGGIGLGEKEDEFMEEDENGVPEDLEGFAWKLEKYIETIFKSKTCFDKTIAIGMEVYPDSALLKDLEAKYVEVMSLETGGKSNNNFNTENTSAGLGKATRIDKGKHIRSPLAMRHLDL
ncbi:FAR1-related sequence 5-like protein [Tanacetum coccineum]